MKAYVAVPLVVGILTIITIMFNYDDRYAKADELQSAVQSIQKLNEQVVKSFGRLNNRFDISNLEERRTALQKRIWTYESTYPTVMDMPELVKYEYLELKTDLVKTDREIKKKVRGE